MDLDVDGGTILYVLGVGFALAALAYFVRDVVFSLSITVKAALLFLSFLMFFLGGIAVARDVLDRVALVLAAATYVVFLVYVVTRYDVGATAIFLALGMSGLLFVGLGYGLRQYAPTISPRNAKIVALVLIAAGILLVGADVATGDVRYSLDLEERVTATPQADGPTDEPSPSREITVGTVQVTNGGPFTRVLALPTVGGCVVGTDAVGTADRVYMQIRPRASDRTVRIAGGETLMYDVVARLLVPPSNEVMTLAVERGADCEVPREEPTLVVSVDEGDVR